MNCKDRNIGPSEFGSDGVTYANVCEFLLVEIKQRSSMADEEHCFLQTCWSKMRKCEKTIISEVPIYNYIYQDVVS